MSVSEQNMNIAKEIMITLLDKGVIIFPAKMNMSSDEISKYNELRSKEISNVFESLVSTVVNAQKNN